MCWNVLELAALFEDYGACPGVITDCLALERVLCEQRALVLPPPSSLQLVNWHVRAISCLMSLLLCHFTPANLHFGVLDLTPTILM